MVSQRRTFMRGPLGGYLNQPIVTTAIDTLTVAGGVPDQYTMDVRPPKGQIWAPSWIAIVGADKDAGSGAYKVLRAIGLYDGSTFTYLESATTAINELPGTISFGSGQNGPIKITYDNYLRLYAYMWNGNGWVILHYIAACDRIV